MKYDKIQKRSVQLSRISLIYDIKLCFRLILFLTALIIYREGRTYGRNAGMEEFKQNRWFLLMIWLIFAIEMIVRFFPSRFESMGCQKQFFQNYCSTGRDRKSAETQPKRITLLIAGVWFLLNGVIGILYYIRLIDKSILLLICLAYSVCDIICILFFCPFQSWFMKNKCCRSCRIYNWDYAMMFTPLILIPNFYTWSILALAIALLIRWEITFYRYPERFSEKTNATLHCSNCNERLCIYKKKLKNVLQGQQSSECCEKME